MTLTNHPPLWRARLRLAGLLGPEAGPWALHTCYFALYATAVFVGRLTATYSKIALVWPAAGVGFAWILMAMLSGRGRRDVTTALTGMAVATYVLHVWTGVGPASALAFCAGNIGQASVAAYLYRGHSEAARALTPALDGRQQLFRLCLASAVGGVVGALGGPLVTQFEAHLGPELLWQAALRNGLSALAVGAFFLRAALPTQPHVRTPHAFHQVALGITSLAAYTVSMHVLPHLPLMFLVTAVTIWAATTLTIDGVVLFTLGTGLITVVFTLAHAGPFVLAGPVVGVFLAQGYIMLATFTGLVLALVREERARLLHEVNQAREEAVRQAALVAHIVTSMDDPIVVVGEDGIVMRNEAARQVFSDDPGPDGDVALRSIFTGEPGSPMPLDRALRGEVVADVDILVRHPDTSQTAVLSVRARPIDAESGLAVAICHDVTDTRRHVAELSSFAGVVAHDLLNPLGAVEGWLEVLDEELAHDPERIITTSLARARTSTTRMRDIITGLHSYSVARGGELSLVDIPLQALVQSIAASRAAAALAFSDVVPQIAINARQTVHGDRALIAQVLDNLIGNSIKYTDPGNRPWIHVTAQRPKDGWVTVRVDDAGIGIPEGQEEKVFEEFHRVPGHAHAFAGTGLGLSICRRMIERHGGQIHAEARQGGGTRMEFTLPAGGAGTRDVATVADRHGAASRAAADAVQERASAGEAPAETGGRAGERSRSAAGGPR